MGRVKIKRRYDSSWRRAGAERNRQAILGAAGQLFLQGGYAATTVEAIARAAEVSVETIYKAFGGKPGLVRAIYERGLAGRGEVPANERSDAISTGETDPRAILRAWGTFVAEVSPLASPILLLVRSAAATDPELAAMLDDIDRQRLARMRLNARRLAARGFLKEGVTVKEAADVMWALTSPELYHRLVVSRGWTPRQLGELVTRTMIAALLPAEPLPRG